MSESDKAINLFLQQKAKIVNFPNSDDEFWRISTLQLVTRYIGKKSYQYDLISGHTFYPNGPNETESSQRERGERMIDSCITYINMHGIKNKSKKEITNIHIENAVNPIVNSTLYESRLIAENNLNKENIKITIPNKPKRASWIEPLYWIMAIIVSCCMIYEFILKYILFK